MLNVLFAGSPECAVPSLEAVARAHRIVAVLTNPPARSGRSNTLTQTPVALETERLITEGIISADCIILIPEKITDDVRKAIAETKPDIMVCFAFGKIFGPKTLALFPLGALNLHPSLLPRWRGCAPVPAAILARDSETGITIQKMALEMDAGDIIIQKTLSLDGTETADALLDRVSREGAPFLVEALERFERGNTAGKVQNSEQATYCTMLCKDDGKIDWSKSALEIDARIRAFHPWPGAFTESDGAVLMILKAHPYTGEATVGMNRTTTSGTIVGVDKKEGILVKTGEGLLAIERLQWRTKKPLDWKSFLNGSHNFLERTLT